MGGPFHDPGTVSGVSMVVRIAAYWGRHWGPRVPEG